MSKTISKVDASGRNRLFFLNFEKNPLPLNTTTLPPTRAIALPRSADAYHIRTVRRLKAFDPKKLHWSVIAPYDLSKSALVRRTSARRVREAFRQELRLAGWDSEGRRTPEGGPDGRQRSCDLSGALKLALVKDAFAVTASAEEVRQSASWAVKRLFALQSEDRMRPKKWVPKDSSRQRAGSHAKGAKAEEFSIRRIAG